MGVSNGRWRAVGPNATGFATDLVPNLQEIGFTIYLNTSVPTGRPNLVFTKPSGATLLVPPFVLFIPLRNETTGQVLRDEATGQIIYGDAGPPGYGYYIGSNSVAGRFTGTFVAYIFDQGDLSEAGQWGAGFGSSPSVTFNVSDGS